MNNQKDISNEILELERKSCQELQNGNLENLINYFADDVMLFNPGSEILIGKEYEMSALQEVSKIDNFKMSWEPTAAKVSSSEDMAYVYGVINITTPDGINITEKYVTIWEKRDNEWKLSLQIRNANQ
jgi:ketosteroid isomerase-like protein